MGTEHTDLRGQRGEERPFLQSSGPFESFKIAIYPTGNLYLFCVPLWFSTSFQGINCRAVVSRVCPQQDRDELGAGRVPGILATQLAKMLYQLALGDPINRMLTMGQALY